MIWTDLNRTRLECKVINTRRERLSDVDLNRTRLECKGIETLAKIMEALEFE